MLSTPLMAPPLPGCTKPPTGTAIVDRYRCPEQWIAAHLACLPSTGRGYFRFGGDTLSTLFDDVRMDGGRLLLPFNPEQLIDNLRYEHYASHGAVTAAPSQLLRHLYYSVRPLLRTSVRQYLQRIYMRAWNTIPFPHWPLDVTVERLFERLLLLSMKAAGIEAIPFIWFWPEGASSAAMMTHDVETPAGQAFCGRLMDIDESFGVSSSFQVVPEGRYAVSPSFLNDIRARGHEINVQDLNHDGHLFRTRAKFEARVQRINQYGREFGAKGFRAAVLYRNLNWYGQLDFEYDMSVPNIGHLEAQRGGCCTVFPYFIGHILELPLTTTQDYSLFHILRDYTLDLWKTQAAGVMEKHGLLSFIVHPDYLLEARAQDTYRGLLTFLHECRAERGMWLATASQINQWWRQRSQMTLLDRHGTWRIEGPGSERAQIAYVRLRGDQIVYTREGPPSLTS